MASVGKKSEGQREELAKSCVPLAKSLAMEAARKAQLDFDGVYSAALGGLLEAVDSYDPSRKVKFASYAHWSIGVRIGRHVKRECDRRSHYLPEQRTRRRGSKMAVEDEWVSTLELSEKGLEPDEPQDGCVLEDYLEEAIAALPSPLREVVDHLRAGRSVDWIAQHERVSPDTVRRRVNRVRSALRRAGYRG